MKFLLFAFAIFVLATVCLCQDDYDDEGASQPSSILARARSRSPLLGKQQGGPKNALDKLKKNTSTTPAPPLPQDEAENVDDAPLGEEEGDFVDENVEVSSAKPTEAPKKLGQSARPFRSNQDLLESLKRRREQRVYVAPPSTTTSFTPVQIPEKQAKAPRSKYATSKGNFSPSEEQVFDNTKKSSNSRSFKKQATAAPPVVEEELEPTPAPKTGRGFGGRSRRL